MGILAAKCPCCGRDIGFDEHTEDYTCIFCGAQLKVAALKTQLVQSEKKPEPAPVKAEAPSAPKPKAEKRASGSSKSSGGKPAIDPEEVGLTQEQIDEQLKRKAEFKEELHSVVRQIDEFRARRPKLESKRKAVSTLIGVGIGVAVLAGLLIALFATDDSDMSGAILLAGGIAAIVALVMLVIAYIRSRDIKKQQARLEETILEKKQKRDILIGRLNKINKTLHIHSK